MYREGVHIRIVVHVTIGFFNLELGVFNIVINIKISLFND